jgi:spore coat polysaccharide biosynthesis protein SpsF
MRTGAIIQARTGSTRLPGKVLADLGGEPTLTRVINRTRRARTVDAVVVATTTEAGDDPLAELCAGSGTDCYRGSEADVLDRYYRTALEYGFDPVVRITADCPLIEPAIIDLVVSAYLEEADALDYVSNINPDRTWPRGLDTEVMSFEALSRAWEEGREPYQREHVTPYLYRDRSGFRILCVRNTTDLSRHRWTLDTPEDLALLQRIYDHFRRDDFTLEEVLTLLDEHREWQELNRDAGTH